MTRSRLRKLKRVRTARRSHSLVASVPLTAALVAWISPSWAQESEESGILESIVVTAQKRQENLQDVPVSVQAFSSSALEELHISDFDDYAKFLPTVSFTTIGPGASAAYMRGVASGENNNHSGPRPSVGIYLDEQAITTIQGALDVHLYDIARVEALAGPQGTLYGASSQAGTLRIITNKPDATKFSAGYDLEGTSVSEGGNGYIAEGFVNIPLSSNAAIRLVGWKRHDPGFIDNVLGTRTFPVSGVTVSNAARVEEDYNEVDTYGARAALKLDLNDSWTVTPTLMGQEQKTRGSFGFDPSVGEFALTHVFPDGARDKWVQAALTVEGKISNFDLVYAGAYLKRSFDSDADYSDYSYHYDRCCQYGAYIYDDAGDLIDPSQYIKGKDRFKNQSHELRLASPADSRLRFVTGLFAQLQEHRIEQRYLINNLASAIEVPLWPDTIWLTEQEREDKDYAVFGEVAYDLTDRLTATGGLRYFEAESSLKGFFGYGAGFSSRTGEAACFDQTDFNGAPCINLDKSTKDEDFTYKLNLAYNFDDQRMVYATWSTGYRPGGVNRRERPPPLPPLPPYKPDFLTNYEVGWKTMWAGNRFRFNGAVFLEEWDDFQFSFLGLNGLTEIRNAAQARITGIEADFSWAATSDLTLSGGVAFVDAELTENYCGTVYPDGRPVTNCSDPAAPADTSLQAAKGTELPTTPKIKSSLIARYEFPLGSFDGHVQGSAVYQDSVWSDLRSPDREVVGVQPSFTLVDFSIGATNGTYSLELFINNAFDELAEITRTTQCSILTPDRAQPLCGAQPYIVAYQPRTYGLKFGQRF